MANSSFYYTLTQAECPECRAIVPAVEYGDADMVDMDFVCEYCGHEEISVVKQLEALNEDRMKGGHHVV